MTRLAVLLVLLTAAGCAHERVITDAAHPEIEITAAHGVKWRGEFVDADKILAAHKDPSKYPDLVVRVTGFTAYFNSLSPAFRQLVVKRLIREAV